MMRFVLGLLAVIAQGTVPFTDQLVAECGASLANELAPLYLSKDRPNNMIVLNDEVGWSACREDLDRNYKILAVVLRYVPSCVPSLLFLAMTVMATDAILEGKVCNACKISAYK